MKKSLKTLAAVGLSSVLLASLSAPTDSLASKRTMLENVQNIQKNNALKGKQDNKLGVSEDSFTIKFNKPLTTAEHHLAGGTVIRQVPKLQYAEIKVKNKQNLAKVMKAYQKISKVESVRPSYLYKTSALSDPKASEQYQHLMLQTEQALKLAGKNKVTVAVIDTGTDSKHPELKNNILPGYNAANPANQNVIQDYDHGTHVSGIIAGEKGNGIGGHGMNPNAKILPIDVFDGGGGASDVSIAQGILYAVEKGAKVINMSLGGPGSSAVLEEAVATAIKSGVVVVAAAGNASTDSIDYPAGYEGVISVGSINNKKQLSYYSNYGPSVDIVAPGEDVFSTVYNFEKKSTFVKASGTSMASPVVAGVASLLLSKYPNLTPAQVEYVLEKTANDLGEKGFDTKFANGLIDPVRALSFNVKNIPNYVKMEWSQKEVQQQAEPVEASQKVVKEGAITKPNEQQWIKFDVKKGEYIQTVLEGSKNFDYKIMGHFFSKDNKVESFDVNDTQDGTVEGKLVQAPFDGTVAIGVKDVNGSFDDSSNKESKFKLSVEKVAALPQDESTVEQMVDVSSLPYSLSKPFTLAGEKGDYDYFTLKVKEEQMVKINMSGIPGMNTAIGVYNVNNIIGEDPEAPASEKMSEADKLAALKAALEGEEAFPADFTANSQGVGKGEMLTFTAQPDQEYIIKVSGDAMNMSDIDMLFALLFGIDLSMNDGEKPSSIIPYKLNVTSKVMPADEDGLDSSVFNEEEESTSGIVVFSADEKNKKIAAADDSYLEQLDGQMNTILGGALPYTLGEKATGYIQNDMDQDFFVIEPEETAIYQFGLKNSEGYIPFAEIMEVSEEKGEEDKKYLVPIQIGTNMDWSGMMPAGMTQFYTGLEKGKKYIVSLSNNPFGGTISSEPYELTSKKVVSNPSDAYEPNDEENIKDLPGATFQANFAMPNDIDTFYYRAENSGIQAISLTAEKATEAMKQQYPQDLLGDFEAVALLIEDTNNNRKLDDEDNYVAQIEKGPSGFSSSSFKTKKGQGYIIQTVGWTNGNVPISLLPYTFKIEGMDKKDEVSSQAKPIVLKRSGNTQSATGFFNAGINGGDEDWYQLNVAKDGTVTVSLEAGKEIDGVISIYQNGKLIKQSDLYHLADNEVIQLNLKKGNYQVKINDAYGTASITPYTLKVTAP